MLLSKIKLIGYVAIVATGVFMTESCTVKPQYPDGVYAEIQTTKGIIVASLDFDKAPMTVTNFVGLSEGKIKSNKPAGTPFYDGIIFHRVIKDFMIQTGDPEGTGRGGPGYQFPDEIDPSLKHSGKGILSMANSGPNTNGSQFFITHTATPHLDGRHTVFGHVIEGMDIVDSIATTAVGAGDKPSTEVKIEKVTIVRVGELATKFLADQQAFDKYMGAFAEKEKEKMASVVEQEAKDAAPFIDSLKATHGDKLVTTASGLMYVVTKEGEGDKPTKGITVKAHYTGKFLNGQIFDSSVERNQVFEFPVGGQRVIAGWDEAFLDMKKGEKRVLVIPSKLGYGARGAGPIQPYTTLVFEVEMVDF